MIGVLKENIVTEIKMNLDDSMIGALKKKYSCTQNKYVKIIFNLAHKNVLRIIS